MTNRNFLLPAMGAVVMMSFAGCSHSYPEYDEDYCIPDITRTHKVAVHVEVDETSEQWQTVLPVRSNDSPFQYRYSVAAFRPGSKHIISSAVSDSPDVELQLPIGKVEIAAWVDYVPSGSLKNTFYFNEQWDEILCYSKSPYIHDNAFKTACWGKFKTTIAANTLETSVKAVNATARIEIYANDDRDAYARTARISYPNSVPAAIDGFTGNICYYWDGCGWDVDVSDIPKNIENETFLGYDIIPANKDESIVQLKVLMRDEAGGIIARKMPFDVPIKSGHITRIKAPFFSIMEDDPGENPDPSGGFGIDPSFEDDVIITID